MCGHSASSSLGDFRIRRPQVELEAVGGLGDDLEGALEDAQGNLSVGAVVSQSLKSLCGLVICSRIFSRVLSQLGRRWQF